MKKKISKLIKKLSIFVASLVFGVLLGILLVRLDIRISSPFWWTLVSIIISLFLVINIHEFGHYIVGKMLGYSLISYRISFFSFDNSNGNMKFSIKSNKGYGGLCAMMPNNDSMSRFALYISGGIIMNLLTGVVFVILGSTISDSNIYLSTFLIYLGVLSVMVFLLNGFPLSPGNIITDGKFLFSIFFKRPYAKTLAILLKTQTQIMVGIRPRELEIKVEEFSKFNMLLYLNAYFIAQDKSDLEEVKILIEKIEENIEEANSYNLNGICYEICFCACIFGDKNKAIKYYNKCKNRLINDKDINGLRVRAYYEFYINDDVYKAKELCNEGLSVKNKFPIIGQALMEESLINKLLEDIK